MANPLAALLGQQSVMTFAAFMEQALYHPEYGFYASGPTRTGLRGDFLTPVSPGPVLGQLLARQAAQLRLALGHNGTIRLIEQGADAGCLARDLLDALPHEPAAPGPPWELHLIEPLPRLIQKQKETLQDCAIPVRWHSSWKTVPVDETPVFFYSCELVDSFPVRTFQHREGKWRERLVAPGPTGLTWQEGEVDPACWAEIEKGAPPSAEGFTVELRPGAAAWVQSWSAKIRTGLVLTLDYGFPASELYAPLRSGGTLVALRGHRRSPDPLADPGLQDLTAHVNFTELEEWAAREGWRNYGLTDFSRGLTSLAAPFFQDETKLSEAWIRNFRHLTHPAFFGHTHKILIQGKALPASFQPSVALALGSPSNVL